MSVATRPPQLPGPRGAQARWDRLRERTNDFTVTPRQYERVAEVALIALAVIVVTGAAVRLTGSGLGCPDWPRCYGRALPPLDSHALIEFANRVVSGLVGVVAVLASLLAWRRRPYRRDLARLALLLPIGVLAQAVLGGIVVRDKLSPTVVMLHFVLSMLILVAAVALVWRARAAWERAAGSETHRRPGGWSRAQVWAIRGLGALGALTLAAGTVATAAGPHSGGTHGQAIDRLSFKGGATLDWTIHRHGDLAALLGVVAVGIWLWLRRTGAGSQVRRAVAAVCVLLALQGAVGLVQYYTHLPTGLVWVHVTLATATWLALLWAVAAAGSPAAPRVERVREVAAQRDQARARVGLPV